MDEFLKGFLEDKKVIIMSWVCFINAIVQMYVGKDNWELIIILLSFSFFPNLMKEFIKRKYSIPEEVKNEGDK
jgi:hypothetical protein